MSNGWQARDFSSSRVACCVLREFRSRRREEAEGQPQAYDLTVNERFEVLFDASFSARTNCDESFNRRGAEAQRRQKLRFQVTSLRLCVSAVKNSVAFVGLMLVDVRRFRSLYVGHYEIPLALHVHARRNTERVSDRRHP